MKICPDCKMTVREDDYCSYCGTNLSNVSEISSKPKRHILNKHLIIYLLKSSWFSLLCLSVILLRMIISMPEINKLVCSLVLIGFSLIGSLFQRIIKKWYRFIYKENFATFNLLILKYVPCTVGVFYAIFKW